jgi:hypothetical protein
MSGGQLNSRMIRSVLLGCAAIAAVALGASGARAAPPVLTTPGSLDAEATSARGATVGFSVTADDARASITCNPPSGSVFGIGTTTVVCTATGPTGEASRGSFTVTVVDTTGPEFSALPTSVVKPVNGVRSGVLQYTTPPARDAVDGAVLASCTPPSGSRVGLGSTNVVCTAVDERGNTSSASFTVRLVDRVAPPDVANVVVRGGKGLVSLSWRLPASTDVAGVVVVRYPGAAIVYRGRGTSFVDRDIGAGGRFRYAVTSYDWAGNRAKGVAVVAAAEVTPLIAPQDGSTLKAPPLLEWKSIDTADYYNVQLWALKPGGAVKVFSTWPRAPHLQLASTWTFQGKKQRLAKGKYRWYVWPGIGRIVDARYGELIGTSTFVVG